MSLFFAAKPIVRSVDARLAEKAIRRASRGLRGAGKNLRGLLI